MNQYNRTDDLEQAAADAVNHGIPDYALKAWRAHRSSAMRRGIPFNFNLVGWNVWWNTALKAIGPDARRGRRKNEWVMARFGDKGPYEPGNVFPARPIDNARSIPEDVRIAMTEKAMETQRRKGRPRGTHLKVRGDGHPKSKPVLTPAGRFGSIALAAEHYGVTRACGSQWLSCGKWQRATE